MNSVRKMKDVAGPVGLSPSANIQKMDRKLTPVWGGRSLNLIRKMRDCRWSVGLSPGAKSQKMDLKLNPVWGGAFENTNTEEKRET